MNVSLLTFILNPSTPHPDFQFFTCVSFLSIFQTRLLLHTPISDCSANHTYYNITISFHHFQNVIVGE